MSPLDDRPHVLVVYGEQDEDNGNRWPETVTQFPTRPAAEEASKFLSNYGGVETDVFPLHPPANDSLTAVLLAKHTKPTPDEVSLGDTAPSTEPFPKQSYGYVAATMVDAVVDTINTARRVHGVTTRDAARELVRYLTDAYSL